MFEICEPTFKMDPSQNSVSNHFFKICSTIIFSVTSKPMYLYNDYVILVT